MKYVRVKLQQVIPRTEMIIPIYRDSNIDAEVLRWDGNTARPTRVHEVWAHRGVFNNWLQQVKELTNGRPDEKHALMDLALSDMRDGLLTATRAAQLEVWIEQEKENDLAEETVQGAMGEDKRIATAVSEAVSATLAHTRITPCENCLIGCGSIFIALLLFVLGTAPFLFSRGLMEKLFSA
jgi:hypothetical protein